jgi:hypothetical protein
VRPSKEITFLATKTQIKTKQGPAKEKKFNTVLCINVKNSYKFKEITA